jgi:hypothetical protein
LRTPFFITVGSLLLAAAAAGQPAPQSDRPRNDLFRVNQGKPLLDAHNCYPDNPLYTNRLERALNLRLPIGIEQDIAPYRDPATGMIIPKVTHSSMATAMEPTLKAHFFERVRPAIEKALKDDPGSWPVIVLHFDFKNNDPELLRAVWNLLREYESWITTAPKTADGNALAPFDWKPLLVLTEDSDIQEQVFYRDLPVGAKLRLFGSAHTNQSMLHGLNRQQADHVEANVDPTLLLISPATNYRRWWNNPWRLVEEGGQRQAGEWTAQDRARLDSLVAHAHQLGYWIRFYTLDGYSNRENQGWSDDYNFGSHQAVEKRWRAAWESGVDLIATDQYELLDKLLETLSRN